LGFPSLSERAFFRTRKKRPKRKARTDRVSISFRESLLSDRKSPGSWTVLMTTSFHLFQREPSFGLEICEKAGWKYEITFPSLSERAFFRTIYLKEVKPRPEEDGFHLFQREPSFGLK